MQRTLGEILNLAKFRTRAGYEPCLSEIVRRGGIHWALFLRNKFDTLMSSQVKPYKESDQLVAGANFNLELLTALRRVQKRPDPLHVCIDEAKELVGTGLHYLMLKLKS